MFIKSAWAASGQDTPVQSPNTDFAANVSDPSGIGSTLTTSAVGSGFSQTILFTVVLVLLFYILLIRPQQKRYKEHSDMLGKLGIGDKIVTQGGMIGSIDSLPNDKEAMVDFGNGIKMTVLRSSIMGKYQPAAIAPVKK